jgi:uncharacterized protein (DUF58 family)
VNPETPLRRFLRAVFRPRDEWLIVFLAAFLFLIGTNTQTGWLFVVDAFLAALLGVGYILPRLAMRDLHFERDAAPAIEEGRDLTVRLRVHNRGRHDRSLINAFDEPAGEIPDKKPVKFLLGRIEAQGTVTLDYEMRCPYRGVYRFGPARLETAAPVGLFPATRLAGADQEIVVWPVGPSWRHRDRVPASPRLASEQRTRHRVGHSYDLYGLRPYQPGDDTRRVHWPLTARTGELMVREFRDIGTPAMTIFVEHDARGALPGVTWRGHTPLDEATRLAASLLDVAHGVGADVTLAGSDAILQRPARAQALDWLARLDNDGQRAWGDMVTHWTEQVARGGVLWLLLTVPQWDEAALDTIRRLGLKACFVVLDRSSCESGDDVMNAAHYDDFESRLRARGYDVRRWRQGDDLRVLLSDESEPARR